MPIQVLWCAIYHARAIFFIFDGEDSFYLDNAEMDGALYAPVVRLSKVKSAKKGGKKVFV